MAPCKIYKQLNCIVDNKDIMAVMDKQLINNDIIAVIMDKQLINNDIIAVIVF